MKYYQRKEGVGFEKELFVVNDDFCYINETNEKCAQKRGGKYGWSKFKMKLWNFVENPQTSKLAQV